MYVGYTNWDRDRLLDISQKIAYNSRFSLHIQKQLETLQDPQLIRRNLLRIKGIENISNEEFSNIY